MLIKFLLVFAITEFLLALTPGPVVLFVVSHGMRGGLKLSLRFYRREVSYPNFGGAAGALGFAGTRIWPEWFTKYASNQTREVRTVATEPKQEPDLTPDSPPDPQLPVIDDHAPPPAHTLPSRSRALRTLAFGLVLWILPLVLLLGWRGWNSLHAQEYRFFTQAAFVTFGGAYAVLAYVTQAAVGTFGWLSQAQAIDGLALAETTPGPLVMVLQFVGFMAGWNNPAGLSPAFSGVLGALVTTYATFLPCFLFIFLGAPYIEILRGNKSLTGALTGITAAVVGVILNLALVFGVAVIWPQGLHSEVNWFAAVLSVVAFVVLHRFKLEVHWVVFSGGLIGLASALLVAG